MRVISGTARSLKLKTLEGLDTRPTTDRIKETLFNMIQNNIYNCCFLDLFAGSGAIGIEALSRGAKQCVFVDNNPKTIQIIDENLGFTKLKEKAIVLDKSYEMAINILESKNVVFDVVFMDPPYGKGIEKNVLELLAKSVIINNDTIVIVEASLDTDFNYLDSLGFEVYREKLYKTNKHIFIRKNGESDD
ncbi:MAG: 16S rRNA (guanine(966)-N(2))-methyltransferase RsmD [Eubacterium sp.]|nr:16S rRNA (guanine(966)-N(2))-methyltransferase RsmD [Eubacterium sp.]